MSESSGGPDLAMARDHLVTVQTILERSSRIARPTPYTYIAWSLTSVAYYLGNVGALAAYQTLIFTVAFVLTLIAYALTLIEYVAVRRSHVTTFERQAIFAFAAITTFLWILKLVWYANDLIDGRAYGLLWSSGFAVALCVVGIGPMRPLLYGGLVLAASLLVGGLYPGQLPLILALGNLLGIGGPGVYFLIHRVRNG